MPVPGPAGDGTWTWHASLGVLGPSAGAETVQRALHEATGSAPVRGWDAERGDRPALQLGARRDVSLVRRRVRAGGADLGDADLGAHGALVLGTVTSHAEAGLSLRIGRGTTRAVGPPDTAPGAPDFAVALAPAGTRYVHVGVGARAVGRDATFEAGEGARDARAEPVVLDARAGLVVALGRWRLGYTHALRTRAHRSGRPTHAFGSLNVAASLR